MSPVKRTRNRNRAGASTTMLARSSIRLLRARAPPRAAAAYSNSITYSGGQASVGQGGFYGSGGARCTKRKTEWNASAVASAEKVASLAEIMDQAYALRETITAADPVSEAAIESKASLKKLMTSPATVKVIDCLEVKNEPVWGLTQAERSLVREAREMSLNC